MDGQRFDHLTRALAGGTSRRTVIRGMGAGLAAAVGLRASRAKAGQVKKPLCHFTGSATTPWTVIEVAEPAWQTHYSHGDHDYIDCCDDTACNAPQTCGGGGVEGQCGAACAANGSTCATNGGCCSGICQGGACAATVAGTCPPGGNVCDDFSPNICADHACYCYQTPGDSSTTVCASRLDYVCQAVSYTHLTLPTN